MAFSNPIVAGTKLVRQAIESENFQTGVSGWRIERDGDAEFHNVTARGDVTADEVRVSDGAGNEIIISTTEWLPGRPLILINNSDVDITEGASWSVFDSLTEGPTAVIHSPKTGSGINARQLALYVSHQSVSIQNIGVLIDNVTFDVGDQGEPITMLNNDNVVSRVTGVLERGTGGPAPFTAETVVDTVNAKVFLNRKYRIEWHGFGRSTVAGDRIRLRIRLDNISGTIIGESLPFIERASVLFPVRQIGHFTAGITDLSKNIVLTMERFSGTGNITAPATAEQRVFMICTEIA